MRATDRVVLLHGLGRTSWSLVVPRILLRRAGFVPVSIRYPSRTRSIQDLATYVRRELPDEIDGRLHFFTHSLGGLVARYLLRVERPANLGRVVMLSPPNQGSQLARRFGGHPGYRAATGPTGQQLSGAPDELARLLGPVDFPLGVITGSRRTSPLSLFITGPNDGAVAVDETRVPGMTDFLVVPRGHTFIMNDPRVIDQAVHFLRVGRFRVEAAGTGETPDRRHNPCR